MSPGPEVVTTVVRVDLWVSSIGADTSKTHGQREHVDADVIDEVAEDLVANALGSERTLLSKSLREALYYAVGFETEIDPAEFHARLSQYLVRRGTGSFIRRFLSLFFFNFVRFHTGESFRALARSSVEFQTYLEQIDRVCQKTVVSVWKSLQTKPPLDLRTANELVREIEKRLRG